MQSRMSSFTESCLNTASGFVISFAAGVWRRIFNHRQKPKFDLVAHLERQRAFSARVFGPRQTPAAIVEHVVMECDEIRAKPDDLEEWIDVVILAFDGAWRFTGATSEEIVAALVAKQTKNEGRQWPDWRTAEPDKAIEHVRPIVGVDYAAPGGDCIGVVEIDGFDSEFQSRPRYMRLYEGSACEGWTYKPLERLNYKEEGEVKC